MVVAPHRDGGQAQFIERPFEPATPGLPHLERTRAWALERLEDSLTVADLARHACVSRRSFARHFRAETGTTPLQWLLAQRVLRAQEMLERSDASVEEVATRCGFSNAAALRHHFRRVSGTTPTGYRRAFS
jgi:transcriptional regulator GlxA family with amidase domain